jgi:hypothetical protein
MRGWGFGVTACYAPCHLLSHIYLNVFKAAVLAQGLDEAVTCPGPAPSVAWVWTLPPGGRRPRVDRCGMAC